MVGCSGPETKPIAGNGPVSGSPAAGVTSASPGAPPAISPNPNAAKLTTKPALKNVTAKDIAKIDWINGSFKGTGADKPFYNRYTLSGTTLRIESFDDEAMTKFMDKSVYELKDGMFANPTGQDRFAASEISDDVVEFVAITEKPAILRYERVGDGTFKAIFEYTGADGNQARVSYIMVPLKK